MTDQAFSRVDKFLADVAAKPVSRGNLIFALDATGSRERTWDTAAELQTQMFREIAGLGSLDVQLVYFRGTTGFDAECKASGWVSNPMQLAKLMSKIRCETGDTQIRRVLDHALRETAKRKVDALVFVGDACEEKRTHLVTLAEELGRLKVPVFMFQEGRDQEAEMCFREIAEVSHGAYQRFDQRQRQHAWANCSRRSLHSQSAASRLWNVRARPQQGFCSGRCASPSDPHRPVARQNGAARRRCKRRAGTGATIMADIAQSPDPANGDVPAPAAVLSDALRETADDALTDAVWFVDDAVRTLQQLSDELEDVVSDDEAAAGLAERVSTVLSDLEAARDRLLKL